MDIAELEREVDRTEQLLARCDEEIIRLEALVAFLEEKGVDIYNNHPPHEFEVTKETRIRRQIENHPLEIYEKSGEDFLEEFKEKLAQHQKELPALIENYQKATCAYEKALAFQSKKS